MTAEISKYPFVNDLIMDFQSYLKFFLEHPPFKRYGQLEHHQETIRRRRELGSARVALGDGAFLWSLYKTLKAWGIGSQASKLRPFEDFVTALAAKSHEIAELDGISLEQDGLKMDILIWQLWDLILTVDIVGNASKLVACSKTLHHILPDLVVPMDRRYTRVFFGWPGPKFQYDQFTCFGEAFRAFHQVSTSVRPSQYAGTIWNTSLTKVIDNAIVGRILSAQEVPDSLGGN
jgi:hypothetical protein